MVLYHGTTFESWKGIYNSGKLKVATKENTPYFNEKRYTTEYGYVYLTDNVIDAIEYAAGALGARKRRNERDFLVVIKVNVRENELTEDETDNANGRMPLTNKNGKSYKIKRDISLDEIEEMMEFIGSYDTVCQEWVDVLMKKPEFENKIIWVKPTLKRNYLSYLE